MKLFKTGTGSVLAMVCLLCTLFSSGYSQADSTLLENRKIVFGVEGFSQVCSRTFSSPGNREYVPGSKTGFMIAFIYGNYYESYDASHDRAAIGYGGHVNGNARLSRNLRIKFGFGFEQFRLKTEKMEVYRIRYDNYYMTYYTDTLGTNWQYRFNYTMFSVPLSLNYYFPAIGKTFFNAGAGVDMCAITAAQKKGDFGTISGTAITKINNTNELDVDASPVIFANVQCGMNYYISGKHFISVEPYYKWKLKQEEDVMKWGEKKRWYAAGVKLSYNF